MIIMKKPVLRSIALLLIGIFCLSEVSSSGVAYDGPVVIRSFKNPTEELSSGSTRFEVPLNFSALKDIHKGSIRFLSSKKSIFWKKVGS